MWRILLGLLALAGSAHAQAYGNQFNVKTFPETGGTFTISAAGTQTLGEIRGLGNFRRGLCVLKASSFVATGTVATDVFLQVTPDNGVTWTDFLRFGQQVTTATPATSVVSIIAEAVTPGLPGNGTIKDAATTLGISIGTSANGPFGDRFRVRATTAATTITFTFSIACAMAS